MLDMGADFITRIGWSTIRLLTADGARLDWNAIYAGMQPGELADHEVLVDHSGRKGTLRGTSTFRARLVGALWEFLQRCTLREHEVLGIEAVGADRAVAFEG
ncbi:hypothetical protein SR41_17555, partial [Sphingomonas melonis]